ncbi:MAG: hypothetical protein ABIH27_03165 [Candidatus Omnitrophota bacterium]
MFDRLNNAIIIALVLVLSASSQGRAEKRDPFISTLDWQEVDKNSPVRKAELTDLVLKGLLWNKVHPVAIINDQILETGDNYAGWKVEKIERDGVILSSKDKIIKITVEDRAEGALKEGIDNESFPLPVAENLIR